jgi:hypothetical protein
MMLPSTSATVGPASTSVLAAVAEALVSGAHDLMFTSTTTGEEVGPDTFLLASGRAPYCMYLTSQR